MSLRTRLLLAAAYLVASVVVALEVPLALNTERRLRSELSAHLVSEAALVAARGADRTAAASSAAAPATTMTGLRSVVSEAAAASDARVLLVDSRGRVLVDSTGAARRGELYLTPERPEFSAAIRGGRVDTRQRRSEEVGDDLLLVTMPVVDQVGRRLLTVGAVRVSEPLSGVNARVRRAWLGLGLIGLAVVAAGVALAWLLARSLVRPVERLEGAARRLGAGDLEARAPVGGPTEIATTASAFNRMADALAANLRAQREFVANASHQLRTPLTGLLLRLEAIEGEGGAAGQQAGKARREVDRLTSLVSDLLVLARGSSVQEAGAEVDLAAAARDAAERWSGPAAQAGKRLTVDAEAAAPAWTSPGDVAQILDNLIENALRYSGEGRMVAISAARSDGGAALVVADDGPGIGAAERERIFDRFYRGDVGRAAGPGTGLGLAVVSELAGRWGGRVRLLDGPGTRIEAAFTRGRDEA
jgi:two-component system, OmpR family, sensor kinase